MHAPTRPVLDTTGSLLWSGRWHHAGTRLLYAAEHASLAALETLIHSGGQQIPPRAITLLHLPDDLVIENAEWMEMPASQDFGDIWFRSGRTAVLRVPSIAVNGMESNFVLNPFHPEFPRIRIEPPQEFLFSRRFFAA